MRWQVGNHVAGVLQSEAEINVYYSQNIGTEGALQLAEQIKGIYGVKEARLVDEKEAYDRMEKILGEESKVLDLFEENPFSPFLEVKIDLEQTNLILADSRSCRALNMSEIIKMYWTVSAAWRELSGFSGRWWSLPWESALWLLFLI